MKKKYNIAIKSYSKSFQILLPHKHLMFFSDRKIRQKNATPFYRHERQKKPIQFRACMWKKIPTKTIHLDV